MDFLQTLLTSSKTSMKGPQYKYMADILGGGILSGSGNFFTLTTQSFGMYVRRGSIDNFKICNLKYVLTQKLVMPIKINME